MKFTKHIHVLQLLSTVPRDVKPTRDKACMNWAWPDGWEQKGHDAWDHLFTYIHANWPAPCSVMVGDTACTDVPDCRTMLNMGAEELTAKLESLPPYFSEVIFPVAVARYLLRDRLLCINPHKLATFTEFHNRYGQIIQTC